MSKSYSCPAEKKIIHSLSRDLGTTVEQIFQVVDFQRKILKETMEKGEFEGVRFPYLGKFVVNQRRLIRINNKNFYGVIHGEGRDDNNNPGTSED